MEIKKENKYSLCIVPDLNIDSIHAIENIINQGEKNLILDFSQIADFTKDQFDLILKLSSHCKELKGILVVCLATEFVKSRIESLNENELLTYTPKLEEAEDFIFMNELENEFGDIE